MPCHVTTMTSVRSIEWVAPGAGACHDPSMPADQPTILATSGGWRSGDRTELEFGPLLQYGFDLSGVAGRRPRLCHVGTALGDQRWFNAWVNEAARVAGVDVVHLNLFHAALRRPGRLRRIAGRRVGRRRVGGQSAGRVGGARH